MEPQLRYALSMRFVKHSTISDWGLGVVAAEDDSNLQILFEDLASPTLLE
jgi:hypothetical protein